MHMLAVQALAATLQISVKHAPSHAEVLLYDASQHHSSHGHAAEARADDTSRPARSVHFAVRIPAVLTSFVHGRLARELMIARVAGVSFGTTLDDEGTVGAMLTVAEVRAGGNDPAATFVDSLAVPVMRVRSDQV